MHFITDRLTAIGMGLAGLKKVSLATERDVSGILNKSSETEDILVITRGLATSAKEDIEKLRKSGKMIVEIPDRAGGGEDSINRIIREVVGFEVKS
ncbi:MAG: hypothetical protein L6243_05865 [Candidatus Altiarchaeales archaeon]|nr:hypothetical protein [Candidatus Altiarchaeota archaeon]MBU4340991.1 hypothetical protein [Candidatus Altiarchaeota archaeon]MBU4405979.1 hypothetical protein [Candidatus Altiarchaeota archaeon]MBU4437872.1 hypothetical protein [Candidatus Altiarchaeota archaeon]MCG2783098.1 hypothetical protein [Candidatus Altiarchaeales archaeon]